jgi:site-specific DNA-methyltransferase (adenine-specific)
VHFTANVTERKKLMNVKTHTDNPQLVPLLPPFTSTRRADTGALEGRVLCMDAIELLRSLPDGSVDMVLADLPYGVLTNSFEWDVPLPLDAMWQSLKRVIKPKGAIVLTATQPFTSMLVASNYEMFRYEWIWYKNAPSGFAFSEYQPLRYHESILVFYKQHGTYNKQFTKRTSESGLERAKYSMTYQAQSRHTPMDVMTRQYDANSINPKSVLEFEIEPMWKGRLHPTQKPVALFEYLIKTYTQPNELVLDMTCGSGTTAIAARKTGRRFICGDLSSEYVALAQTRLANSDPFTDTVLPDGSKQLSLFRDLVSA